MKEFEVFDHGMFLGVFEYDESFQEDDVRDDLVCRLGYPSGIEVNEVIFK